MLSFDNVERTYQLYNEAIEINDKILEDEKLTKDQKDKISAEVDYISDIMEYFSPSIQALLVKELKTANSNLSTKEEQLIEAQKQLIEVKDKIDKQQGLQLTVFSMVIAIMTFILNNSKIISASEIQMKQVLLVNISSLLTVSVLFSLIYIYINNSKMTKCKIAFLVIAPLLLVISLIVISLINF